MISIISTNFRMSGGYINHLDLYDFIREYDPNYYYMEETPLWRMLLETGRNYKLQNPIKLNSIKEITDDIVITDFRGLIVLNNEGIVVRSSKFIIMDCVELTFHLNKLYSAPDWFFWFDFSYKDEIHRYLTNVHSDEIVFLMPPSNHRNFSVKYPTLKSKVFFKKINVNVLREVKDGFFDDALTYSRRPEVLWHEQFGRRIFEYILLDKHVYFNNDPFMKDDGLSDYLKYYDIKFDGRRITNSSKKIIERMKDDGRYLQSELLL